MYPQISKHFFLIYFLVMLVLYQTISPSQATDFQDEDASVSLAVSQPVPMNEFDQALAIAKSRLSFYKVRQQLLEGKDEVSLAYQKEIAADQNTNITTDGGGLEIVMTLLNSPEKADEMLLTQVQKANRKFIYQWQYVKKSILNLQSKWNDSTFQSLLKTRDYFAVKKRVDKPAEGYNVHKDLHYIASDVSDFDGIQSLLMKTEPYLQYQQIIKAAEEKAKRETQRQEYATKLWSENSLDDIAAWINEKKDKQSNSKKKNTGKKATKNATTSKKASAEKKDKSISLAGKPELIKSPIQKQIGMILPANVLKQEEDTKSDDLATVEKIEKSAEHDDLTARVIALHERSGSRPNKKHHENKDLKDNFNVQNPSSSAYSSNTLRLDNEHISTLQSVLRAASHPPVWNQAVKAVCEIIKQWGGSYREDRGKGSAVEFWIRDTRFIVDKTHSNGLMYRAQMKFMAKGLERAGITLDLLDKL